MRGDQVVGAGLPQLLLSLLGEAPGHHPEALLVQVASQEVAEAGVAAGDVDILVALVGDSGQLLDPAVHVVEHQQPQEVEEHDAGEQ